MSVTCLNVASTVLTLFSNDFVRSDGPFLYIGNVAQHTSLWSVKICKSRSRVLRSKIIMFIESDFMMTRDVVGSGRDL